MPSWNDIRKNIYSHYQESAEYIDIIRNKYIKEFSETFNRNIIVYYSGWLQKSRYISLDYEINDIDKMGFMSAIKGLDKAKGVDIILHTPGGNVAATESLVDYIRAIFNEDIRAIIPQLALSAGTMLALSCKEIVMGKHSSLGPIDPQIRGMPTHGILEEFEQAKKELNQNPALQSVWGHILSQYSPTLIGECQKAVTWAETMVSEWLVSNMLKDKNNKEELAKKITEGLGKHSLTLAHNRHISQNTLQELGVQIASLEDNQKLQDAVLSIHHACMITFTDTRAYKIIESQNGNPFIQQHGEIR